MFNAHQHRISRSKQCHQRNPVCAPEICIVEIINRKYDNEMYELLCTVIITVKKGKIVYIMHDVSHDILILDTVYDF